MYNIGIVDGDRSQRIALRSMLSHMRDFRVLGEAGSATEALDMIDAFRMDIILVDIDIPDRGGIEVVRRLKSRNDDARIIVTTGREDVRTVQEAIRLRADDCLLKPIGRDILIESVCNCICRLHEWRSDDDPVGWLEGLLDRNAYQEVVVQIRHVVDRAFTRHNVPARDGILDLAKGIVAVAAAKDLDLGGDPAKEVARLRGDPSGHDRILATLLGMIDRLFDAAKARAGTPTGRLRKAIDFIERNLNRGITLNEVADHVSLSPCHFSRLFKQKIGLGFSDYLTKRRIDIAKDMIRNTEMSITTVALDLSYSDVNHFSKTFKKHVGIPPSAYRRSGEPARSSLRLLDAVGYPSAAVAGSAAPATTFSSIDKARLRSGFQTPFQRFAESGERA